MQTEDENRVQNHVEHSAANHDVHGLHRIAGSAYETGEVERHGGEEHAGQYNEQVFTGV